MAKEIKFNVKLVVDGQEKFGKHLLLNSYLI